MKAMILLLTLMPSVTWAQNCTVESDNILARFESTTTLNMKSAKKTKRQNFEFIRQSERTILYRYPDSQTSNLWYLQSNGFVKNVHYFDEFKHAIEYHRGDMSKSTRTDWSGMYQLVSQKFIDSLENKEKINACDTRYYQEKEGEKWSVTWSNKYNLPLAIEHTKGEKTMHLKLLEVKQDKEQVAKIYKELNTYQSTDFADIGDNESDPFIRKMIRLGFVDHGASGFYDSNGNALEGQGHSEHRHK
ncbi:MAG: hypothetical protein V5786_07345 [Psychromonas sp.]